ncbi:hypothetical protein KBD33_00840 [Candidatus Gracilibacteria bacterium]|nr:hypothetical protein [Candidatus Gracilibacteria bacterium]
MGGALFNFLAGKKAAEDAAPIPSGIQPLSREVRNPYTKRVERVLAQNMGEQRELEAKREKRRIEKNWTLYSGN